MAAMVKSGRDTETRTAVLKVQTRHVYVFFIYKKTTREN